MSNGEIRVISFDAFPVAAGFGGLGLAAGKEPCSISGASAQLFGIISSCFGSGISRREVRFFGCLDDHLCMAVSTGNSADRPIDVQRAEFQVKIAPLQAANLTNSKPQFQPQ